jgi:hypothetical protein
MKKKLTPPITGIKKPNPETRNGILQCRVNLAEMKVVHEKAVVFCGGDLSKFVRMACLNYKPLTKKAV